MWEAPFSPEFLDAKEGVVIWCPEEHLSHELFDFLSQNGITWRYGSDMLGTKWDDNGEDTAYYIKNGCILYGSYKDADWEEYAKHIKCTFYGIETPDFNIASDDEVLALLGIGGE